MPTKRKQSDKNGKPPAPKAPGVISPNEVYRKDEFLARVGWSDDAFRTAKRNGLSIIEANRRVYVVGKSFLDYLDKIPASTTSANSNN